MTGAYGSARTAWLADTVRRLAAAGLYDYEIADHIAATTGVRRSPGAICQLRYRHNIPAGKHNRTAGTQPLLAEPEVQRLRDALARAYSPHGFCASCARIAPVLDGTITKHPLLRGQGMICPGSGKPPRDVDSDGTYTRRPAPPPQPEPATQPRQARRPPPQAVSTSRFPEAVLLDGIHKGLVFRADTGVDWYTPHGRRASSDLRIDRYRVDPVVRRLIAAGHTTPVTAGPYELTETGKTAWAIHQQSAHPQTSE